MSIAVKDRQCANSLLEADDASGAADCTDLFKSFDSSKSGDSLRFRSVLVSFAHYQLLPKPDPVHPLPTCIRMLHAKLLPHRAS